MLVRTDTDTFSDTSHGLTTNVCAAVDGPRVYQPTIKRESNVRTYSEGNTYNPITIPDDEEQDAAEISCINLDSDEDASAKGHHYPPIKKAPAEAHDSCFQPEARRQPPCNDTQEPNSAAQAKSVAQPLFRALTKDDLHAADFKLARETHSMGFNALCKKHDPHRTGNTASTIQGKKMGRKPSNALINEERNKYGARKGGDAPQLAMNVLNSKRKYTMNELGYNELVSPAQIVSPSEKSARIAKRHRRRQDERDPWARKIDIGDAQSAIDFAYGMTGEGDGSTVTPIVNEQFDIQETVARPYEKRCKPSVSCETSSFETNLSADGQKEHPTTRRREDDSDGHMNAHEFYSTQTTVQNLDAQKHDVAINAANSNSSTNLKRRQKPRIGGPTSVCGVFSPEKKPPVKRSNHGAFHCPRCDSHFTTSSGVNYHFEKCVALYGNPRSLRWHDHPSLVAAGKRTISKNRIEQTNIVPARVPAVHQDSASHMRDVTSAGRPLPITNVATPSPAFNNPIPDLSSLPEQQPISDEQASSCPDGQTKSHHRTSIDEHRAIGGKGLSAEALKSFQELRNWDDDLTSNQSADEAQDEDTEVPDVAYQYFVEKREWLETEDDAIASSLGPYHTMNEANVVAKAEVQFPQTDGFKGIQSQGWSYYYRQDERGMQTHLATVLGINIEAVVHRGKYEFWGLISGEEG